MTMLASQVANAADAFVTCSVADPDCSKASRLGSEDAACVKRDVVFVHNKNDPDYLNALTADPDLVQDSVVFRCVTVSQKDDLMRLSGIENETTTVQATYTFYPVDKESKSGASHLAATAIATISVLAYSIY